MLTVEEIRLIDAQAHAAGRLNELVSRAGWAVARSALGLMGGAYGRRVCVVAGRGNNGADGRIAASLLSERGALVQVVEAGENPGIIEGFDLVVDAAYGTGFHGSYRAPQTGGARVLAVDIPSGVDANTGEACDGAVRADSTVTFAALKPGLLYGEGLKRSGRVSLADIGLDVSQTSTHLIEDTDVSLSPRAIDAHKWVSAVAVVAGSPGMTGAAKLTSMAALRAGAGMVRLLQRAGSAGDPVPTEVVAISFAEEGWEVEALQELGRCRALAIGPGLGREEATRASVKRLVSSCPVPVAIDSDAIYAFSNPGELSVAVASIPSRDVLITPHEGEFARLTGRQAAPDRIAACKDLARTCGCTVLLKGPTTTIASPDGRVMLTDAGGPELATAGSGDVLTGLIAAFVARGLDLFSAAGFAAHVHGRAGALYRGSGLVAGDLLELVPMWLSGVEVAGG